MKINPLPQQTARTFEHTNNPHHWEVISEDELERHVLITHCEPFIMHLLGIPNYDLEVAVRRGFDLRGICLGLYRKIGSSGVEYFHHQSPIFIADQLTYLNQLIKTLLYIDQLQPGVVEWDVVAIVRPDYRSVKLNPEEDIRDVSFFETLKTHQQVMAAIDETLKTRQQVMAALAESLFGWLKP